MKIKFSFMGILAVCLIGLSVVFVACEKDNNTITIYKGQVVHAGTSIPFADLEVKLTDGQNINASTRTDAGGYFFVQAALSSINDSYYFLIGDASCEQKQVKLFGWGQSEVNLGIIEVQGPTVPVVELDTVLAVATTSATFKGHVISDGRCVVTERGFCYAKTDYPTIDNNHKVSGKGIGEFISSVSDLESNTTYYVCAYATNEIGTAYSRTIKFTTSNGLPTITTVSVTNITAKSAICNADVTGDGGFGITACGVCWSTTSATPIIADKHTSEVAQLGTFASQLINLTASTTYYVRAYATNEKGTSYGDTKTFTTTDGLPAITTVSVTNITAKSAVCNANITSNGGYIVTACGVCWSATSATPTIADAHTSEVVRSGAFAANVTNLSASTTYYIRAYVTNENGTSYGDTKTFTTTQGLPTVTTTDPGENITSTSIATGGNVTDDGGFTVTARGVVYSTLPYPTLANASKVVSGSGTGYFSANITNVSPVNNTYYIRAYATNSNGTAYGEQIVISPERIEYLSLPTIIYGGYKYHIYKDMGKGDWNTAKQLCDDLTFAGYSDWYLPDEYELVAMIQAKIDGWYFETYNTGNMGHYTSDYWTSGNSSVTRSYVFVCGSIQGYGTSNGNYLLNGSTFSSNVYRFRAVRKDKIQ